MTSTPTTLPELDSAADVLGFAQARRRDADHAEADVFGAAATWAEQHPAESITEAAAWAGPVFTEQPLALAGPGAPLVAEFCLPELAAVLGMSPDSGRLLVAHAVETKHRLPRLWRRVMTGEVPVWRARRVAEQTLALSLEAAGFVDAQVAGFAHSIGPAATERLVAEAVARFMPAVAAEQAARLADGRHVTFHHGDPGRAGVGGTTFMDAELDAADAHDLDAALSQEAAVLKAAGCDKSLDVRRAMAAGHLARHQLALDLAAAPDAHAAEQRGRRPKARQVVLYVHLSQAAIAGGGPDCLHLGRLENGRRLITADQVRGWCADADTQVTVRPVIDLEELVHVEAYEVPERLAEQARLRDHTCVFPWCSRPSRTADCDHVVPHQRGGPTCSCNLAPLCRRHHRTKTHATWSYTVLGPGTYLWSSPHGYQYLRDHTGTRDVTTVRPTAPPGPMHRDDSSAEPPDRCAPAADPPER